MKATVLIFVQTRNVTAATGQPLDVPVNETAQELAVLGIDKTSRADKSIIQNASNPPLWTWFTENPRPDACNSFRRLAVLTFAT
jgi:hypothetical protein